MLWFVYKNIVNRKLRSLLSSIGIAIGIFAIFSMLSIGQGIFRGVEESIKEIGADKIIIIPQGYFSDNDVRTIEKVEDVEEVLPIKVGSSMGTVLREFYIYGIDIKKAKGMFIETGYRIGEGRIIKKHGEAILGYKTSEKLKKGVGDKIEIEGRKFKIVGVLEMMGSRFDDYSIIISQKDFEKIYPNIVGYQFILVKVSGDPEEISEEIKDALKNKRGSEDFEILTQKTIMEKLRAMSMLVTAFFLSAAIISLLVGTIGVMNSIYTSVHERIKIIGLLRAIGASRNQILKTFLEEAVFICLIGFAAGVILGTIFVKLSEKIIRDMFFPSYKAVILPEYYILCAIVSIISGVAAGFLPARKASKIPPAEALRYE